MCNEYICAVVCKLNKFAILNKRSWYILFRKTPRKNSGIETVRPSFLRKLSGLAQDTSDEDTDMATTTDDDDDVQLRAGRQNSSVLSESNDTSSWWCTIV